MARAGVREFRPGDIEALLPNIRPADIAECEALLGPGSMEKGLRESVANSTLLWTGTADEELVCIFGVGAGNMLSGLGLPWLIGTPLVDKYRSAFIRFNRAYIPQMLAVFPQLANVVDVRNRKSIAWLKRLGFTVHPPVPCGAAGALFHPFTMEA